MKQKDIVLVIVMVFIGAVLALIISRVIFASPKNTQQSAEVVDVITPDFPSPSRKYFNQGSVDPASHTTNSAEADQNGTDQTGTDQTDQNNQTNDQGIQQTQ